MRGQGSGWKGESRRHSLARKGVKTANGLGKVTSNQDIKFKDDKILINGKVAYELIFDTDMESFFLSTEEYDHPDGFKYKIAIKTFDSYEWTGDEEMEGKYWMELNLIPKLSGKQLEDVIDSIGQGNWNQESIYYESDSYGYHIPLRTEEMEESELSAYRNELAIEGTLAPSLIGFYLDKPVNRLGETGWDWLEQFGVLKR